MVARSSLKRKPRYIIDPRKSLCMSLWDAVSTLALLYTALVTPFEVAFLQAPRTWADAAADGLFMLNRAVDVVFVVDILVQFFLMYKVEDAIRGVKWVDDPKLIRCNYLKSWFAIDLFSTLPSLCDILPLFLATDTGDAAAGGTQLRNLRLIRCARLVRLVRLLRASRVFKRWETRMTINCEMSSWV